MNTVSSPILKEKLTPREAEILALLSGGYKHQELAHLLGLAICTVHSHVRQIYRKLGVHSKTEAVFEARQLGLLITESSLYLLQI